MRLGEINQARVAARKKALTTLKGWVVGGESQASVARRLKVTPPHVNDLLNGRRNMSDRLAEKILG